MTPDEDEPIGLTDGAWVINIRTRVLEWHPAPSAPTLVVEEPAGFDADAIGCRCGATVTETCRSKTGGRVPDHKGRKPRVCGCGVELGHKRQLCDDCRDERARQQRHAYKRKLVAA